LIETRNALRVAQLLCSAAIVSVAGCGGGGTGASFLAAAAPAGTDTGAAGGAAASSGTGSASASLAVPAPAPALTAAAAPASASSPMLADCEMFPPNAIFNTRIDDASRFPAHPKSAQWIDTVGRAVPFSTDWGANDNPADYSTYYGMPINVVDGTAATTDWPLVSFDFATSGLSMQRGWPDKSDCAVPSGSGFDIVHGCGALPASQRHFPFPLPGKVLAQGGNCNDPNACGDHPVLVVEKGACRLWESYFSFNLSGQWYSLATAAWDLKSLSLRPNDWASASASGLPITPLLAKAAEANSGEIRHALRVNFRDAALALDVAWPARFAAGGDNPGAIPFGALLRLKPDFVIPADWTTQAKALATAAKRYGLYVSDNGADFHVQGEPSAAWDLRTNAQMKTITMNDMEFVDLKAITGDPRFSRDSMAASW
jgi:hypothetical protein